ncbi:MAG TPA: hypothetical protein VLE43_07370, partial [Candidatus Saccharimonadia bacterium]|nr:hypothetical protein [Candidatus Saccharimonadia bacterium]
ETTLMEFPGLGGAKGNGNAEVKPVTGGAFNSAAGFSIRNGKARVELPPLGVGVYEIVMGKP